MNLKDLGSDGADQERYVRSDNLQGANGAIL